MLLFFTLLALALVAGGQTAMRARSRRHNRIDAETDGVVDWLRSMNPRYRGYGTATVILRIDPDLFRANLERAAASAARRAVAKVAER